MVTKRRISEKDWNQVVTMIKSEFGRRKGSQFRKDAEVIWKELDRQVSMKPMNRTRKNQDEVRKTSWRTALELGDLSTASEILSADIRRLGFPENWYEAHSDMDWPLNEETGEPQVNQETQIRVDTTLRAMMNQQHADFGFLSRQDLSVKEALHHGSYVVEVGLENMLGAQGPNIKGIKSPVWIPHSMWNCYPDDSKAAMASNLFYAGNMVIKSYQKWSTLQQQSGEGWNKKNIKLLEKPQNDKDIELVTWHGAISIPRKGAPIYIPNVKVTIANDRVIYYEPNPLPYSRIIYNGYERLDVRNPYYVSPLTKMSPTQKIASTLTNKYIDAVEREVEPSGVYDGNDADLMAAGGPSTEPGVWTPTKNLANYKIMDVVNSAPALEGVMFHKQELQRGTGVDNIRSGMTASTEQTATEVERTHQGGQIRTIDFLDKHEKQGLRPWLYLQHEMNKATLKDYKFYNPEMDAPDFERISIKDLPKDVQFEVVGSKGLLEAEQRSVKTMGVTKFLIEIGQGKMLNLPLLAKSFYADAGNKNSGRFLNLPDKESISQNLEEAEQQLDEAMQQVEELQQQNQQLQMQEQSRMEDAKVKGQIEGAKATNQETEIKLKSEAERDKNAGELQILEAKTERELALKEKQMELFHEEKMFETYVSGLAPETEPEESEDEPKEVEMLIEGFNRTLEQFAEKFSQDKTITVERDDQQFIKDMQVTTNKPTLN